MPVPDAHSRSRTAELFLRLLDIVELLRSPEGCPWDREQSPRTIAPYLVEEAHEVLEAVESGDPEELCEELGDVLLEVALLAQMARENEQFTAADSLASICDKLVRRHPHVFAGEKCRDAEDVRETWARIKAREKRARGALQGVPRRLPALHRARRVSEKASGVGFDWPGDPAGALTQAREALERLGTSLAGGETSLAGRQLGDLLFTLATLARHLDVDAEAALHGATEDFLQRFSRVEEELRARGRHPAEATPEERAALWREAQTRSPDPQPPDQGSH